MGAEKIVVLGIGGTIAGTASSSADNVGYSAGQLGLAQLIATAPSLAALNLHAEDVARIDSKDMDFAVWRQLARRCAHWLAQDDVQALVITHGTDTLEETAFFLAQVLAPAKPIVLTCAMRPATAMSPDGPQNLVDAFAVARTLGAQGVVAVCAGVVHAAADVSKSHPYRLDAFSSGEVGPVGVVEEGVLRLLRPWPAVAAPQAQGAALRAIEAEPATWPRVEIVLNHAGATGAMVDAIVAQGVDGIVAAGTGNGTLAAPLEAALLRARAQGVWVVRATRCALGSVVAHADAALPDSAGLSPVKARIAMLLSLLAARSAISWPGQ
ncbi:MAG TPA: asparaginase [Ramlibacter sp.]|nr:asparaginase [Ramlibacter sp.]